MTRNDVLGRGFALPIRPDENGTFPLIGGAEVVRQAIEVILTTEPGERIGLPSFGCGLRRFLMAPNTTSTRALMGFEIEQALQLWEPRINLDNVAVTAGEDPSLVWIEISYVHRADSSRANLVYPFYLV